MGTGEAARFLALVLVLAATFFPGAAREAKAQQADRALPGCGICYPGGYDLNTVGTIRGEVQDLQVPDEGPVRFVVAGQGERWVVLASPSWHWRAAGLRLVRGGAVAVRGSKTLGSDGALYLVAQEIRLEGVETGVALRDGRGSPLWSGGHRAEWRRDGGPGTGRSRTRGACRP